MYTIIRAFTGTKKGDYPDCGVILEDTNGEDEIEAWEFPTESFIEYHPALSDIYEVQIEANDDFDYGESTSRLGRKVIYVGRLTWKGIAHMSQSFLSERIKHNDLEAEGKIRDIVNEQDNSIECNTMDDAIALRLAHASIAANTADYALSISSGQSCIAASTGNFTFAQAVLEGSAAVSTGIGNVTLSQTSRSVAACLGSESLAMCIGEFNPPVEDMKRYYAETGAGSVAICTDANSAAVAKGRGTIAASTGGFSLSECSGAGSVAVAVGGNSVAYAAGPESSAYAASSKSWAKGAIGSALHFDERDSDGKLLYTAAVIVDGVSIKENVLYALKDGAICEVPEGCLNEGI